MVRSAVICVAVLNAAMVQAQSPAYLEWQRAIAEQHCRCDANSAWLWASAIQESHCACGPDCPCCQTGGCDCLSENCQKKTQRGVYNRLRNEAILANKPLLVFVGRDPVKVSGAFSCRWDEFPDVKSGVVVGLPKDKDLVQSKILPVSAKPDLIASAVKGK